MTAALPISLLLLLTTTACAGINSKQRLTEIDRELTKRERLGSDTLCAREMLRELRWLRSYTRDADRFRRQLAQIETVLSAKTPLLDTSVQAEDGGWGACHQEWFFRLDVTSDRLIELSKRGKKPRYPPRFLDPINDPKKLTAYLESILVSDPEREGIDHRKELNYAVSALLRLVMRSVPSNFRYHPELKQTLRDFIVNRWQDPRTGYWGPWYRKADQIEKNEDLSITFHIVSYLNGEVPRLGEIARTTYRNRMRPYPVGIQEDGLSNHHNYDAARLYRYGWPELTADERQEIAAEIHRLLDWTLRESLTADGSFRPSITDDSLGDSFYFGVSFLDEVGYFDRKKRFWTKASFPESDPIRKRIRERITALKSKDPMVREAAEKIGPADSE